MENDKNYFGFQIDKYNIEVLHDDEELIIKFDEKRHCPEYCPRCGYIYVGDEFLFDIEDGGFGKNCRFKFDLKFFKNIENMIKEKYVDVYEKYLKYYDLEKEFIFQDSYEYKKEFGCSDKITCSYGDNCIMYRDRLQDIAILFNNTFMEIRIEDKKIINVTNEKYEIYNNEFLEKIKKNNNKIEMILNTLYQLKLNIKLIEKFIEAI
jgi:hypothetical protein